MPTERTNVSNVAQEHTTTKPARQVQQVAPIVTLENTVQLVRPLAPHVSLENSTAKPARQVAPIVTMENTAQLVRPLVTLRVSKVLMPLSRTNVTNVVLGNTTTK
jgi:hypothetical protein